LDRVQRLNPGDHCHHTQEDALKKRLDEFEPASNYAKTNGSIHEERQKIRILLKIYNDIEGLLKTGTGFCKPPSTCDPMKNKCRTTDDISTKMPNPGDGRGSSGRCATCDILVPIGIGIALINQ